MTFASQETASSKKEMQRSETLRWWESYLIRYALGTIIGALCVYALLDEIGEEFKAKALMMPPIKKEHIDALVATCNHLSGSACVAQLQLYQDLYGFNLWQLVLLGIYGLAYCYIASAPALVIHAARRQLINYDQKQCYHWEQISAFLLTLALIALVISTICWSVNQINWAVCVSISFVIIFASCQLMALHAEFLDIEKNFNFYKNLNKARDVREIAPESYRHLREHGNAFLIVILEVLFFTIALVVVKLSSNNPYWSALLIVWIIPGAAVYFLGHRIEAEMVKKTAAFDIWMD